MQNARDVATPLSGALELRRAFGTRAVLVTVDSTGHNAYLSPTATPAATAPSPASWPPVNYPTGTCTAASALTANVCRVG
ncbi:alpha/beta hydrolase [Streptomyces sp. IMTB 2501]|uniref:alpha/beta hydrolase n=1 Tax=Streptomyces sp. IMTB 2501 TaxID=1776340 RepID=UPI0035321210